MIKIMRRIEPEENIFQSTIYLLQPEYIRTNYLY